MARNIPSALQMYRGTTEQHAAYTGPAGEITVDTTKNTAVVHDGATAGGFPLAKEARTITAGSGVRINSGDSATLADDIIVALGLTIDYTEATGAFSLKGSDGIELANATIPAATSLLESVEFITSYQEQSGAWLHFVFRLSSGSTNDVYVDISSLIDTYTAGTGISISDNQVSVDSSWLNEQLEAYDVTVVSSDDSNVITVGGDEGAYLSAETIASSLTAGTNVQIDGTTISATDTTYTAGTGISIDENAVSVDAAWLESQRVYDLGTMD